MRCEVVQVGDVTVINDAYNASPTAMRAALELLRELESPGRRVVICGDMMELGDHSANLHSRLGREIVTKSGSDFARRGGRLMGEFASADGSGASLPAK